jgi:hypothetical protein
MEEFEKKYMYELYAFGDGGEDRDRWATSEGAFSILNRGNTVLARGGGTAMEMEKVNREREEGDRKTVRDGVLLGCY